MAIRRMTQRWSVHKRRNTLVAGALGAVLIAATVGVTRAVGDEGTELTARNVSVTTGSMQETVSASGTVAAKSTEDLNFSVSGEVVTVNVKQGDTVRKNDVLARIDSASLRAQVAQAEASVASAESKLASDQDADASSAQLNADS
ncbi:MAG: biotin/lipoyl-binding protein, partial [Candidatus Nanopelagicales bacterium]